MCRSRRELSNEYLLAKISVDTAENEPLEVWGKIKFNIHSPPRPRQPGADRVEADLAACEAPPRDRGGEQRFRRGASAGVDYGTN